MNATTQEKLDTQHDKQYAYRCAIALNNQAVTMLERNCLFQARDTLQDAITLMRNVSRQINDKAQSDSTCDATRKLERGVHRLNHPRPCETPVSAHVLSYDPALEAPLSLPITYLQSDTTTWFYPIRIILDENDMTGSADLHSAILLFNFGCTYLSMGQPRALTNAIRVLDLAVTILERMAEAPVVLEFLCLGAILRASRQSHERLCCDMTKYYLERYQEVMTQVSLLEMDKLFTSDHLSAAAA